MTLQERIKGAVRDVLRKGAYQMPEDKVPYETCAAEVTRAVVAVLPKADVSRADIEAALTPPLGMRATFAVDAVVTLLDAQAAAHAAEVEALREQLRLANIDQLNAEAEVEALRAESSCHRADYILALDRANKAEADRDRAVREALENAAQQIEAVDDTAEPTIQDAPSGGRELAALRHAARIVRSLIPGGTE